MYYNVLLLVLVGYTTFLPNMVYPMSVCEARKGRPWHWTGAESHREKNKILQKKKNFNEIYREIYKSCSLSIN